MIEVCMDCHWKEETKGNNAASTVGSLKQFGGEENIEDERKKKSSFEQCIKSETTEETIK